MVKSSVYYETSDEEDDTDEVDMDECKRMQAYRFYKRLETVFLRRSGQSVGVYLQVASKTSMREFLQGLWVFLIVDAEGEVCTFFRARQVIRLYTWACQYFQGRDLYNLSRFLCCYCLESYKLTVATAGEGVEKYAAKGKLFSTFYELELYLASRVNCWGMPGGFAPQREWYEARLEEEYPMALHPQPATARPPSPPIPIIVGLITVG